MIHAILAIDPGASGGLAVMFPNGPHCDVMPATPGDIFALIRGWKATCDREGWSLSAVIEDQTYCAGIAVSAASMGEFGDNCGFIKGVLSSLLIPTDECAPQGGVEEQA